MNITLNDEIDCLLKECKKNIYIEYIIFSETIDDRNVDKLMYYATCKLCIIVIYLELNRTKKISKTLHRKIYRVDQM